MATPLPTNTASFSLDTLAGLEGARVIRRGSRVIRGVGTDTRALGPDALFVALTGERFDGHGFLEQAITLGAAALLVSDEAAAQRITGDASIVIVPDTLVALGTLGRLHRERMEREGALSLVVAITGSVGKTTTKEMCAAVLAALGHVTLRTEGNLNNRIGVPLTLLSLEPSHTAAVIELGMNEPGEIATLAALARPDVGIVTSVAAVHTEGMGTIEAVANEKASLLLALAAEPASGHVSAAIFTVDDRLVVPLAQRSPAPILLGAGRHEDADVRLLSRHVRADGASVCRYAVRPPLGATASDVEVALHLFGEGAARNAACALALVVALGQVRSLGAAAEALSALRAAPGRGALLAGLGGSLLIDDAYNASRRSVVNALEAASELAKSRRGRVIAVLGDMLELGPYEAEEHERVGEAVARIGTSLFVACGPRMRVAAEEARELGADLVVEETDPLAAIAHVRDFLRPEDVIVVKGSRSMAMERVVRALGATEDARPTDERARSRGGDV